MAKLELFWDVGSPYTYLTITQIDALRVNTGAEVVFRPFLLGGVFKAASNTMPAAVPSKAAYMLEDLKRWRQAYDVALRLPVLELAFPINTLKPMRAAVAAERAGKGEKYCRAVFSAYWADGRDVSQPDVLSEVIASVGLSSAEILAASDTADVKDELRNNTDEAVRRGAFGAPAMFIGDELYWGNDRLQFVEKRLRALAAASP